MDPLPTLDGNFVLVLTGTLILLGTAIYFNPGTLSVSRPNNARQRLWRMRRVDRMETVGTYMIRALENAAVIVLVDTAFLVTGNIGLIIVAALANFFVLVYWIAVAQRLVDPTARSYRARVVCGCRASVH